jgi:5S rRNA maturation endonuclease (ribonuclease M5)
MHETALNYIEAKGWPHKERSGQIILQECPLCHDTKSHFYMSPDGAWFCHKCNAKGNLYQLKREMGDIDMRIVQPFKKPATKRPDPGLADRYHDALLKDPEGIRSLKGRGITVESVKRFKLGLRVVNGSRWLSIPHSRKDQVMNIKFRSLPPTEKTFERVMDCPSILFNADVVEANLESIIVCEGELDAITLIQAGFENVVGTTNGAGSFAPDWVDQLKPVKKIFLAYDADEAGQNGARALAKRLGYNRCRNVEMNFPNGGKDVNDLFQCGGDVFSFQVLLNEARPFDLPGVISFDTALDLLKAERAKGTESQGLMTPWARVNRLCRGFRPGDLIIVTAVPKIGKTSWCLNIARELILQGTPVLFYCLEMRPERLTEKFIQAHFQKEKLTSEDLERASLDLAGAPIYFGHSFKKEKSEDVLGLIREAIQRYDLKLVIFDNLHYLTRSTTNINEEVAQATQGFKLLAEEMEIPIIVIAQPRKREIAGRDEVMRAEDVKYSNAVHADCDQMIILHRKRVATKAKDIDPSGFVGLAESFDPVTLVRVEAHRYGPGGETLLYFHGEYSRFDELEGGSR